MKLSRVWIIQSLAFIIMALSYSTPTLALPEYVRFGYFGCQSCHASPSGGGLLTPYGRSVAAERVSTWSYKDEEQPLHGIVGTPPEWFLAGGNFRQIQTYVDNDKVREGRYFTMQRDLEFGVNLKSLWLVSSVGQETSAYPKEDNHYRTLSHHHFVRLDLGESVILRYGKFLPKFGLMIPHHNTGIRRGMGFDQGTETNNVEATFSSETFEVTATAVVAPINAAQVEPAQKDDRGVYGSVSYFLLEKNRLGLSTGRVQQENAFLLRDSVFGALAFGERWFGLAEFTRQRIIPKEDFISSDQSHYSYIRMSYEVIRGLAPYLLHETSVPSVEDDQSRSIGLASGAIWTPRPHFEFEFNAGISLKPKAYTYSNVGYLLFHYYL